MCVKRRLNQDQFCFTFNIIQANLQFDFLICQIYCDASLAGELSEFYEKQNLWFLEFCLWTWQGRVDQIFRLDACKSGVNVDNAEHKCQDIARYADKLIYVA